MASASLPLPASEPFGARDLAAALCARILVRSDAAAVLRLAMSTFGDRLALVSSFGTESALLLEMAAAIDRRIPVIFLETGKLFPETITYKDMLVDRLGLTDVRVVRPAAMPIATHDPEGELWRQNADRCCAIRKTLPLQSALAGFAAWTTGRKRFQGISRIGLDVFEAEPSGRIKVNPLAHWSAEEIDAAFRLRDLPRHPLEAYGFLSIGCTTCTKPVAPGEDRRAGRWRGQAKTECGIHTVLPTAA